jgi:very-short-patch-repair endonuclease
LKICKECGKGHIRKRSKYCSIKCGKIQHSKPERNQKISISRKKFLTANPDKHPWKKSSKFDSAPCNALKNYLNSKGIKFVSEWQPLEERFFSIDIAFPDIKFGIEVNGNQHYNKDGTLTEYYQTRHDIIEDYGWRILELHYSSCYNIELLDSILRFKTQPDYTEYFKIKELKEIEKYENRPLKAGEK